MPLLLSCLCRECTKLIICRSESVLETESNSLLQDNNVLLESIVNDVLMDDVEIMDQEEGSAGSASDLLEYGYLFRVI